MSVRPRDPLLAFAKAITWFFIGVFTFAIAVVVLAVPFVIGLQDRIVVELAKQGATGGSEMIGAIALLLLAVAALLALGVYFLILLKRIIDSVGLGDPFVPANGDRLARMGWITLAGQVASLPVGGLAMWLESVAGGKGQSDVDFGFSGSGILLMVVLFVLARVFRHGAAMREDLEGTV